MSISKIKSDFIYKHFGGILTWKQQTKMDI